MIKVKLLVVEDELVIGMSIQMSLERLGYAVVGIVSSGEEAVEKALELQPDLILMDIILSGTMDGIEAAREIRKQVDIPIIYLTANADSPTVERARDTVPYGYLNKPINERDLMSNIDSAIHKHHLEKRLRDREERYRLLIESLNDILISTDENGIVTYVSPQIKAITGYTETEIVGKNFAEFVHPDDSAKTAELIEKGKGGGSRMGEFRAIGSTGDLIWFHVSGSPAFVNGRFNGIRVILRDITKQKRAEEEARHKNEELLAANEELQSIIEELESTNAEFEAQNRELLRTRDELATDDAMLRSIFKVAPVGIGTERNRAIVWSNSMLHEITGYAEEELYGQSARMLYLSDEDYEELARQMVEQIYKTGMGTVETRWKRKDGTVIDILLKAMLMDPDKMGADGIFMALDITEKKRAGEALRRSEEKYRHLAENISDNLWVVDLKTLKLEYSSPYGKPILGYDTLAIQGLPIRNIIAPEHLEMVKDILAEELDRDGQPGIDPNRTRTLELKQVHKNGSTIWTETTVKFLRDETGKPVSVIGVAHEITGRKQFETELVASEEKYRELAEHMSDYLWVLDIHALKYTYVSPSCKDLIGYETEESLMLAASDVLTPDSLNKANRFFAGEFSREGREGVDPDRPMILELELMHKDGHIVWTEMTAKFLRDKSGAITGILGVSRDITRRKRTELALAASEEKYRLMSESISDLILIWDIMTERFSYVSPVSWEMTGYLPEELLSLPLNEILTPESHDVVIGVMGEEIALDSRPGINPARSRVFTVELKRKDGSTLWIEITARFLRNESGNPAGVLGVARDISERKHAEHVMILQRDLAQALGAISVLEDALALCIQTGIRATGMDSGSVHLVDRLTGGLDLASHIGLGEAFIKKSSHYDEQSPNARLVMKGEPVYSTYEEIKKFSDKSLTKEGLRAIAIIPVMHNNRAIACLGIASHVIDNIPPMARNTLENIAAHIGDIIMRIEMQDSLRRSEEKFRLMIENSPFPIAIIENSTGAITYTNKSLENILGYNTANIPTMRDWLKAAYPDPAYRKKIKESWEQRVRDAVTAGTAVEPQEADVRCLDGTLRRIEFHMVFIGDLLFFMMNDLTEKKINQEMMIQTEKMTSLGGLAAGMAHEINNPLGIILQGAQGALSRLSSAVKKNKDAAAKMGLDFDRVLEFLQERDIVEYLEGIRDAGNRAAKIVSNMLQFSRRSETSIAPVDINLLIDKTIEIASNDYDLKKKYNFRKIQIIREYNLKLKKVPCSETGIQQVILNLLKNAAQAMGNVKSDKFKPVITIRTGKRGRSAVIEVTDNGPGIDSNVQRHIFEPFYTTKGMGGGTGLGLSVSHYIIDKNHNGSITVESKPGKGATFIISLPLTRTV
ncbi:MAG: PAS domain S-box protein [Spirochaetes bacterium]|nr:PAS domain S-box protein [Spirochaetota bacterium]